MWEKKWREEFFNKFDFSRFLKVSTRKIVRENPTKENFRNIQQEQKKEEKKNLPHANSHMRNIKKITKFKES